MALAAAALGRAAAGPPLFLRAARLAARCAAAAPRNKSLLSGPHAAADEPPPPAQPPASKLQPDDPPLPWKAAEAEIVGDVDPVVQLIKDILHSDRYGDGECLSPRDENIIVEKLLAYHPRVDDKIGCGLDAIMGIAKCNVQKGNSILFWGDVWNDKTRAVGLPRLFSFVQHKEHSVSIFLGQSMINLGCLSRRKLVRNIN
uniref:Uncharacterized protein n=1 Tax=Leersia perrieri TaxID=77586 RepID=A0A0D9X6K6_9ORYZ